MNRRLRVRINIPVLIQHLSRDEKRAVPMDEVTQWLEDAGFIELGDAWMVDEADLGHLDPSEVISVEPVDDTAGD